MTLPPAVAHKKVTNFHWLAAARDRDVFNLIYLTGRGLMDRRIVV